MNTKIEQKREKIEDLKEEIESYGFFIQKVNQENIWELEEEEFNEVLKGVDIEIIEGIKKHEIPLFYTKLGSFYPFLEGEAVDFIDFLQKYKEELRDWYKREEDFFEDYEEAETIYNVYCELFDMKEEEIASWYDDPLDACSWRTIYIAEANGVKFFRDAGGYGDIIRFLDEDMDIQEMVDWLKKGEPIQEVFNHCYEWRRS